MKFKVTVEFGPNGIWKYEVTGEASPATPATRDHPGDPGEIDIFSVVGVKSASLFLVMEDWEGFVEKVEEAVGEFEARLQAERDEAEYRAYKESKFLKFLEN